jgi:hypothetical protein
MKCVVENSISFAPNVPITSAQFLAFFHERQSKESTLQSTLDILNYDGEEFAVKLPVTSDFIIFLG